MRQATLSNGLLQTSLCRFDHAFKYAPPPGGLFQIKYPLNMELGEVPLCLRALQNLSDDLGCRLERFPLSEITLDGTPRLAAKRLKLLRKVVAVMSVTKSRCTALVAQHVYKHNHTFEVPPASGVFTWRGPAKSTPVAWNGRDG